MQEKLEKAIFSKYLSKAHAAISFSKTKVVI